MQETLRISCTETPPRSVDSYPLIQHSNVLYSQTRSYTAIKSMAIYTDISFGFLGFSLIGYIWSWLHELSHYVASCYWTNNQKLIFQWRIYPRRVKYSKENISARGNNIIGVAPLVLLMPDILVIKYAVLPLFASGHALVSIFILTPLILLTFPISPTDREAFYSLVIG